MKSTRVHVDNTSATTWREDGKDHARKRHIDVRFRGIEQAIAMDGVEVVWCKGADQRGDFQAKVLIGPDFMEQRDWLFQPLDSEEYKD